jgi:hypothetical protein
MTDKSVASGVGLHWKNLYRIGGVAALLAGLIFRRNLGAEVSLFSKHTPPETVNDWFTLLQNNKLVGLAYLNLFDVVDYLLLALMFLALYAALQQFQKSYLAIATSLGLSGIAIYIASNTAFSMLSLSNECATATSDAQKSALATAGQVLLVDITRPSTGIYVSFLLIALAGMLTSIVMLRSEVFSKATAWFGILASGLDLIYCLVFPFLPASSTEVAALSTIPAAGLFWMLWHILVGWRLLQLARLENEALPRQS